MCLCMHVRTGVRASRRVCVRVGLIYACMIILLYNYICGRLVCVCVRTCSGTCAGTCVYVRECTYMHGNVYAYVCAATCAYACAYVSARV